MERDLNRLDIISDVICPWCYIGKRQLELALPELAAEGLTFAIHWNPFQLNPDMPAEGRDRMVYRMAKFGSAERCAEIDANITGVAAKLGLEFHLDRQSRTPNTVAAHRVIWLAGQHGVQDAVVEALFNGFFCQGRDIGDAATLADIANGAGLAGTLIQAMLASDDGLEYVLRGDAMARNAGISGVPSFALAGHVLFSGTQPAAQMVASFRHAHDVLSRRAA
jgi:predicted DsbA family dithiol-disulfide isomerase